MYRQGLETLGGEPVVGSIGATGLLDFAFHVYLLQPHLNILKYLRDQTDWLAEQRLAR